MQLRSGCMYKKVIVMGLFLLCGNLLIQVYADADPMNKDNKSGKCNRQAFQEQILDKLSEEQQTKLKRLQKENPEAFRKEIKNIVKRYKSKQVKAAKQKEIDNLVSKYRESADNAEKEQLLIQIKEKVSEQFNDKMASNRQNIEKTGKRLDELKNQLKKREDNATLIIEERIKELTKDPSLRW